MKIFIIILSLFFALSVPAYALGDKSVLPATSDAMTGTVRALNQVQPEEGEKDEPVPLESQDVQEKQYQEDQRREKRQEAVERYQFDEPE